MEVILPKPEKTFLKDDVEGKCPDQHIDENELDTKKFDVSQTETVYSTTKNVVKLEATLPVPVFPQDSHLQE